MQVVRVCLYAALSLLVIWYIYTLFSNQKKTSHPFGRKKEILAIIDKYPNISPRTTRQLETAVKEMGTHFYENGEINYEALLDSLARVKNNQTGINNKTVQIIDAISDYIRKMNPFLHISNGTGAIFQKINNDLESKDYQTALKDLVLLYEKSKEVEVMLKKRSRRDFWIGTVIGLIGIAISIITSMIK